MLPLGILCRLPTAYIISLRQEGLRGTSEMRGTSQIKGYLQDEG